MANFKFKQKHAYYVHQLSYTTRVLVENVHYLHAWLRVHGRQSQLRFLRLLQLLCLRVEFGGKSVGRRLLLPDEASIGLHIGLILDGLPRCPAALPSHSLGATTNYVFDSSC